MDLTTFKNRIKTSEAGGIDPIPYFYVDGPAKDLMNIGFGYHFNTWSEFEAFFKKNAITFIWKDAANDTKLSMQDVRDDFDIVKRNKAGKSAAGSITRTRANTLKLNQTFDILYISHEQEARNWYNNDADVRHLIIFPALIYGNFDSLPENAKFVLIDMFYNAGPNVMKQYLHLKAELKMGHWVKAAKECRFKEPAGQGGVKKRNDERALLLMQLPTHTNQFTEGQPPAIYQP